MSVILKKVDEYKFGRRGIYLFWMNQLNEFWLIESFQRISQIASELRQTSFRSYGVSNQPSGSSYQNFPSSVIPNGVSIGDHIMNATTISVASPTSSPVIYRF